MGALVVHVKEDHPDLPTYPIPQRKSFRVEQITTRKDGEIILEGEGMAISIKRVNDQYSAAHKVTILTQVLDDHTVTIKEILEAKGGVAF